MLPLVGGILIGLAAVVLLAAIGRIMGISGIVASSLTDPRSSAWRWAFLAAVPVGALLAHAITGRALPDPNPAGWPWVVAAGLLVGFGTRLGSGCTSGHGVCGISRLSPRSIAATITFMAFGIATVTLLRHGLGGSA